VFFFFFFERFQLNSTLIGRYLSSIVITLSLAKLSLGFKDPSMFMKNLARGVCHLVRYGTITGVVFCWKNINIKYKEFYVCTFLLELTYNDIW
jgi:hypothetical protein